MISARDAIFTQNEMIDSVAENVLSDAMEDIIMRDILMEIITRNEASQLADRYMEDDRIANAVAEGVFMRTVVRMLRNEVAAPLL